MLFRIMVKKIIHNLALQSEKTWTFESRTPMAALSLNVAQYCARRLYFLVLFLLRHFPPSTFPNDTGGNDLSPHFRMWLSRQPISVKKRPRFEATMCDCQGSGWPDFSGWMHFWTFSIFNLCNKVVTLELKLFSLYWRLVTWLHCQINTNNNDWMLPPSRFCILNSIVRKIGWVSK